MTASDAYNRQIHQTDMAGLRDMPEPHNRIMRLPDPEDYAPDSLEWQMAARLRELDAGQRADGLHILAGLNAFYAAGEEWLMDVGYPTTTAPDPYDWDDETDEKEGRW